MKGYIFLTLNEREMVCIPVQNIEYIGFDNVGGHCVINLSVGSRREFAVRESIEEIKKKIEKAITD